MLANDTRVLYMRKRLSQFLQGIWEYPLTVVDAPMGYGKTTAVREFLKGCKAEVLWQTVFDSSAVAFWHGFSRLFAKVAPACAHSLAELGVPGDNVFREEAVELFGGVKFPPRTVIVIDDYHLLSSGETDLFFERLAQAGIPGLHIVIVSRSVFGENTAELALKGYCLVLGKKYFELTAGETVDYCKLCGVRLSTEEAAFLQDYTEGWISAVYLCILGYRQTGRLERQTASLHELIEKVFYQPCSVEMKEFLTVISMFDNFTLPQAEYMWRKGKAEELLTHLTAGNAFITVDHASQLYCMHNILNGFLRGIFDRQDSDRRQALWKAAGEWYLGVGEYNQAMDYFYKAADFERLLTTIEIAKGTVFARQPKEARINYFRHCPDQIKTRHPLAGIIYAFNLFISNEMELFARQCKEVASDIKNSPGLDDKSRLKLMGELEVLKGITAYNNLERMAGHFKAAWELMQGPSNFIDTKMPWTFGTPSVLYMYYRESGQLEAEVRTIAELPCYYRLSGGHGSGAEYVMEAERYYNIGDFDNAEIVAHKALLVAQYKRQSSIVLCATFLRIRLAMVRGDWGFVLNSLRLVREAVKQQTLFTYIHTLDMCEGFVFSCLNQANRIPAWIAHGELPDNLFVLSHVFFNMLWGKALLISGEYHQLAGIADRHAALASFFPNQLAKVYTYILAAAAQDKLGRREEAMATLEKALAIAAPDQVVMPFVENSEYIADLLAGLQTAGHHPEFIGRIREISPPIAARWRAMAAKLNSGSDKRRLTDREAAIAELVAQGLSNQAVGNKLNIAKDTVKKALGNIFIKLGVSNRTALTKVLVEQRAE